MMTIVYHHRTAGRGGEGNHIMSVVAALEKAGHEVDLLSPPAVDPRRSVGHAPIDKGGGVRGLGRVWRWLSRSAPQSLFECAELLYNPVAILRLAWRLAGRRDAVIYERYAFFLVAGALVSRLLGRRFVLEVNEVVGVRRARGLVWTGLAAAMERYVFRRADAIFTVSSPLRDSVIRQGAAPAAVHLMPNAIDPARFGAPAADASVRGRLGLEGAMVVGFVGWFDQWDRLELLIEMCRVLKPSMPALRLLLVGDGPVATDLRALAARFELEDMVRFTGPCARGDVAALIDAMDICVLPHSNDFGSPMVLLEFMARGKAVVAADIGGIPDVVQDGRNGVLIPGGDIGRLVQAVGMLARDPDRRAALGDRARRDVMDRHTWAATAARICALADADHLVRAVAA